MEKTQVFLKFAFFTVLICYTQSQTGCTDPGDLENAFSTGSEDSYVIGATVTYECRLGYEFTAYRDRRVCLANSSWSVPQLSCVKQDCGLPPDNRNSRYTLSTGNTLFGTRATYTCNTAFFQSAGDRQLTCSIRSDENIVYWRGTAPTCEHVARGEQKTYLDDLDHIAGLLNKKTDAFETLLNTSNSTREKKSFLELLKSLYRTIELVQLPANTTFKEIRFSHIEIQLAQAYPKPVADGFIYSAINFTLTSNIKNFSCDNISVSIPSDTVKKVAQIDVENNMFFYTLFLKIPSNFFNVYKEVVFVGTRNGNTFPGSLAIEFHPCKDDGGGVEKIPLNPDTLEPKEMDRTCKIYREKSKNNTNPTVFAFIYHAIPIPSAFVLSVVSYVGCGISIISLLTTILVYLTIKELREKPTTQTFVNICACLVVVYLLFCFGVNKIGSPVLCNVVAAALQFSILSSWFWMCANAFQMYKIFSKLRQIKKKATPISTYLFSYGVPFLITGLNSTIVIFVMDGNKNVFDISFTSSYRLDDICWLAGNSFVWGFLVPIGVALTFNVIIFAYLIRLLTCRKIKIRSTAKKSSLQNHLTIAFTLLTTMGLTWVFGILLVFSDDCGYQTVMQWLFSICSGFQGLMIFFAKCLRPRKVRKLWLPNLN